MKSILVLPFVLALPVFAGTSAKQVIPPPANPCLMSWFVGASVGYLTELEEPMYTVHAGITNSCWMVGGWNVSAYAEVGYTQKDEDYREQGRENYKPLNVGKGNSFSVDEMGHALQYLATYNGIYHNQWDTNTGYDLDIVPITLNVKLERALSGNLNAYFGGGLGVACVSLDIDGGGYYGSFSDTAWVFCGQIFAGLSYSVSPVFEIYGGARWMYLSDADVSDKGESATLELGSDCFLELGARYKF